MKTRNCPDCRDALAADATTCTGCGWVDPYAKRASPAKTDARPRHESACTWRSGQLECRYPVGLFGKGAGGGWCIFHRRQGSGVEAAKIAEASANFTPESYAEALREMQRRDSEGNESIARLRARLRTVSRETPLFDRAVPQDAPEPGSAG